jgi:hypothetical protein
MVSRRVTDPSKKETRRRPATTPEQRENQLIALAADLAERQMRDGTASSQIVTHYLKLGSTREKLEQERLRMENELAEAKIKSMASAERMEELYGEAIAAMRGYAGYEQPSEQDYDES